MDKSYFIEYYNLERNHWWFRARLDIIRNQVSSLFKENKNLTILNVGVATGATSVMLQEFGKVKSVEYDKDCFIFTKEKLGLDIDNESITALPYPEKSFDLVCAFDVIEHVEEDELAVNEMKRVCKEGGHIVVTVPAFMSLWGKHDEVNHHVRRYKINQLKKLFNPTGRIIFFSYFNFYLFPSIYLFRKISTLFPSLIKREGAGSDFSVNGQNRFDKILYLLLKSEKRFFRNKISLPFGVFILLSWKKDSGHGNQQ